VFSVHVVHASSDGSYDRSDPINIYVKVQRTWLGGWDMEGMIDARGPVLNGIVNGIDDE
jgi:hypothetical protein